MSRAIRIQLRQRAAPHLIRIWAGVPMQMHLSDLFKQRLPRYLARNRALQSGRHVDTPLGSCCCGRHGGAEDGGLKSESGRIGSRAEVRSFEMSMAGAQAQKQSSAVLCSEREQPDVGATIDHRLASWTFGRPAESISTA